MAYKHYTRCYHYTSGDDPFNEDDLVTFAAGAGVLGIIIAALGAAMGSYIVIGIGFGVGYAQAIVAVADAWLYHRLICLGAEPICAVGKVHGKDAGVGELG